MIAAANMTPAAESTAPRKRKRDADCKLTIEQITQRRMQERIEHYRALVAKAASGQELSQAELEQGADLLELLGLPSYTLARDVQGYQQHQAAVRAEAEARAKRPAADERLMEIRDRMKILEAELTALRAEQHQLGSSADNLLVHYMATQHQLRAEHPHLLEPIESAVAWRLEQQAKHAKQLGVIR